MERVADGADKRRFRAMMATWHPLGEPSCPGARVNYWITATHHGRLGGLVFSESQLAPEGARPLHRLVPGGP